MIGLEDTVQGSNASVKNHCDCQGIDSNDRGLIENCGQRRALLGERPCGVSPMQAIPG